MGQIRLVAGRGDEELGGYDLGALMQQLIERMLAIGARLASDHRAGGAGQGGAVEVNGFAV